MANEDAPNDYRIISFAFEGDLPPPALAAAVVSLVDLCRYAMPNPVRIRESLAKAGFETGPEEHANAMGRVLAIGAKMVTTPLTNLHHEIFARDRDDEPVYILLSTADSAEGPYVFCTSAFAGAIEADAVKAAEKVTKRQPLTGATVTNADGATVRRVFWDAEGQGGVWGFVVSGPADVDTMGGLRAFTAFNKVGRSATG